PLSEVADPTRWFGSVDVRSTAPIVVADRRFNDLRVVGRLENACLQADRIAAVVNEVSFTGRGAAAYEKPSNSIRFNDLVLSLFGGEASGGGTLPLDAAGPIKIDVRWTSLDLQKLRAVLAPAAPPATGTINGNLQAVRVAGAANPTMSLQGQVDSSSLTFGRLAVGAMKATVGSKNSVAVYRASATVLKGEISIEGTHPLPSVDGFDPAKHQSTFRARNIALQSAAEYLVGPVPKSFAEGFLTLTLPLKGSLLASPFGIGLRGDEGSATATNVKLRGVELTRSLNAILFVREGKAGIELPTGKFAGGSVRADARLNLSRPVDGTSYNVRLANVDHKKLSRSMGYNELMDGKALLTFRGNLGAS
ncbi:MAG: hypothetical protein ACRDD1_22525, partial [Planctomycetia bacterium]